MWKKGRQSNCKYFKWILYKFKLGKIGADAYFLKYPEKSKLPIHTDPLKGSHYRCNITLKGKSNFYCEKHLFKLGPINIFRPDLYKHSLDVKTKTYKLSLGFAILN